RAPPGRRTPPPARGRARRRVRSAWPCVPVPGRGPTDRESVDRGEQLRRDTGPGLRPTLAGAGRATLVGAAGPGVKTQGSTLGTPGVLPSYGPRAPEIVTRRTRPDGP